MITALYVLYAFIQAVLTARYVFKEDESPVFAVVLMTIFAPLVSVGLLCGGFYKGVKWLVTYRPKGKQ